MKRYLLITIIGIQVLACIIGFQNHFSSPSNSLFHDSFDGFKNYITFYTYTSKSNASLLHYDQMNYPYGDFITYTDNTPILAIMFKKGCRLDLFPSQTLFLYIIL